MGTAAASSGAAGPSEGLRAGWSSGQTEAGVHRDERTAHLRERADDDRDSDIWEFAPKDISGYLRIFKDT